MEWDLKRMAPGWGDLESRSSYSSAPRPVASWPGPVLRLRRPTSKAHTCHFLGRWQLGSLGTSRVSSEIARAITTVETLTYIPASKAFEVVAPHGRVKRQDASWRGM